MRRPQAIETTYDQVTYRSRLEARWACLFTSLAWSFDYEPIDLDLRIPDFVMQFAHPVIVECKPSLTVEDVAIERTRIVRASADWLASDAEAALIELDTAPDQATDLNEWDALVAQVSCVRERSINSSYPGRRAIAVGARLFIDCDIVTIDGEREFRVCPPGDHVGLYEVSRGHGSVDYCLVCGRDDNEYKSTPVPPASMLALWKDAGNKTRWVPKTAGDVYRRVRDRGNS